MKLAVTKLVFHERLCQSTFSGPAALETLQQNQAVDTALIRPTLKCLTLTSVLNEVIAPGVSVLLSLCRPVAVFSAVSSRVVSAFDGMAGRRTKAHVSQEGREVTAPLIADRNTSAAVILERLILWLVTTAQHALPRLILGRRGFSSRVAVCSTPGFRERITYATATLALASLQVAGEHRHSTPADTSAPPVTVVVGDVCQRFDHEIVVGASSQILGYPHTWIVSRSNF